MKTQPSTTTPVTVTAPSNAPNLEPQLPSVADELDQTLAEDLLGNLPLAPEIVAPRLALLETWDESVHGSGFRVPPMPSEDEAEFPEVLAEEGLDEAEEEMRAAQETEEEAIVREEEQAEEAREAGGE
ncbi:MAG: hypothetical protein JWR15_2919 [Prosthecobacter sp.]|nr:hypothetical protein [Prosthecobacter sp.]